MKQAPHPCGQSCGQVVSGSRSPLGDEDIASGCFFFSYTVRALSPLSLSLSPSLSNFRVPPSGDLTQIHHEVQFHIAPCFCLGCEETAGKTGMTAFCLGAGKHNIVTHLTQATSVGKTDR